MKDEIEVKDKIVKCKFHVSSRYVGTETEEEMEVVIPCGSSDKEEEKIIMQWFEEWVWENIETFWERIK